jgi:phosphoserine phosphatase
MTSLSSGESGTRKPLYRFVFFDVDSTLVTIEGVDELAPGNEEIARLTAAAMNGEVPLDEVYGRRLELIRPSKNAIEELGALYCRSLVSGAHEAVAVLLKAGVNVHLVTAGIAQAIAPLAAKLGIPSRAVHAVALQFDDEGLYAGFDQRSFLTKKGGKELVVRDVRARSHGRAAFIGDGISDLETRPAVDLFIGFGGVTARPQVKDNAAVFETTFDGVLRHLMEPAATDL